MFFFKYLRCLPPVSLHSTNTPPSSSSTCYSYQKNRWAKPEILPKRSDISEIGELLVGKYMHLRLTRSLIIGGAPKLMDVAVRSVTGLHRKTNWQTDLHT